MADPDPTIRRLALQALVTIRGDRDPALARAVLRRQGDADAGVREWAATMAKEFPLDVKPGQAEPAAGRGDRRAAGQPRPRGAGGRARRLSAGSGPLEDDGRPRDGGPRRG